MSSVARINMLVNDDGRTHIFFHDSLRPRAAAPEQKRSRQFKLILTNPPFGKRIKANSPTLVNFEIAKDEHGRQRKTGSLLTEILFLERNLEWLAPGGKMFVVLPDSVLGNITLKSAREYIERQARLLAIVSLSPDTFGPSGAKSKTSIIVLEKRTGELAQDEYDDYDVFVSEANHVGYDFTGRATGKNDLPEITENYRTFLDTEKSKTPLSKVIRRQQLENIWLAQPFLADRAKDKVDDDYITLQSICSLISTGKTAARAQYTESGLHMIKVGNLTGRGIEWEAVERQFVAPEFGQKHRRSVLQANDILFTAAAHGPKWIGLKVDIYNGAPSHLPESALFCGELMMLRLKPDSGIDPYYLLLFLRSNAGYAELQRCIRGQSGHVYPEEVSQVRVPNPANIDQDRRTLAIEGVKSALEMRKTAGDLEKGVSAHANAIFTNAPGKPIIAL